MKKSFLELLQKMEDDFVKRGENIPYVLTRGQKRVL